MSKFRNITRRLTNLTAVFLLVIWQAVFALSPLLQPQTAYAADPQITYNNFEGEIAPQNSNSWTNGNISGYKEGDTVRFRVDLDSDAGTLNGHLFIGFTSDPSCRFFRYQNPTDISLDFNRATNTIDAGTGFSASLTGLSQGASNAIADFALGSTAVKSVRLNFTLQLDDNAAACATGSSQHVEADHTSGDVKSSGNKSLPIPSTAVAPVTDITVIKSATSTASIGGAVSYTVTVTNLDLTPAANVTISDNVPSGITPTTATYDVDPTSAGGTGTCTIVAQAVNCSIGTLAGNDGNTTAPEPDKAVITINGTVNLNSNLCSTTLTNNVSVSTTTLESNLNNNLAQASTTINPCPGSLRVKKHVINDNGGTKTFANFTFQNNSGTAQSFTVTVSPDGEKVLSLPVGTTYSITEVEANTGGYITSYSGCTGTITLTEQTCTITNDDIAPSLTLNKVLIKDNGGTATESNWTLTATGTGQTPSNLSGLGAAGSTDVVSGTGFKADTYTLTETGGPTGYTASLWICTGATVFDTNKITLTNGQTATCTITNDDNVPSLTLIKLLGATFGSNAVVGNWNLTATGTGQTPTNLSGATGTAGATSGTNFKADTYTLGETGLSGFTAIWSCVGGNALISQIIAISLGQSVTCTVTNTAIQPKLTVTKVVNNDNGGTKVVSDFPLNVSGTPVTSGVQNGFNVGTYTVGETPDSGYTAVISGHCDPATGSVTLALADVKSCTITNTAKSPSLTLNKVLIKDNGGTATESNWTLTATGTGQTPSNLSGLGAAGSTDVVSGTGFKADTYTLTETGGPTGYTASLWICTGATVFDTNKITLTNGQTATCTITNDDISPTLTVNKIVVSSQTDTGSFNLQIDGSTAGSGSNVGNGGTTGAVTVAVGSHTVSESAGTQTSLSDYVTTYGGACDKDGKVALTLAQNATCTITNTRKGNITIIKDVQPGFSDQAFDFKGKLGDFALVDNGGDDTDNQKVFTSLAPDTYSVTEPANVRGGWSLDSINCNTEQGVNVNNREVNIKLEPGQNVVCTFVNTRDRGSITVHKITRPTGDSEEFTIRLREATEASTLSHESLLQDGESDPYSVVTGSYNLNEENIPSGWDLTDARCTRDEGESWLDPRNETLDIVKQDNVDCFFTNTKRANVIVAKYNDLNRDGSKQNDEPILPGWDIILDQTHQTTGADGTTTFNNVLPSRHILSETVQTENGWHQGNIHCDDEDNEAGEVVPEEGYVLTADPGATVHCTISNYRDVVLNLSKTNNRPAPTTVGDTVTYTLVASVPEDSGVSYNTLVTDLPPNGFVFVSGSETATQGNLTQAYGSPGQWSLGTILPGHSVTLTYRTLITSGVNAGTYPDIAFANGCGLPDQIVCTDPEVVLSNLSVTPDNPFVATNVTVNVPQVLGASTTRTILVNTGTQTTLIQAFSALLLASGLAMAFRASRTKEGGTK